MKLHNIMEDKVEELATQLIKKDEEICKCERCKLDVMALTLNEIQPKYVVSDRGELFGRANLMTTQYHADLVKEVTKAIDIVRENPSHD